MEKYSIVNKKKNGFEWVVAYPDKLGIETLDGLYGWEMNDPANRMVVKEKSLELAKKTLKGI